MSACVHDAFCAPKHAYDALDDEYEEIIYVWLPIFQFKTAGAGPQLHELEDAELGEGQEQQ